MIKKILNKVVLVLIGLLLALILLEMSMWIAGFTISSYQKYKNDRALKNKSQYTVMCIGESTTAGEYPIQLQEILNKRYPNKFSIIDAGIEATCLETILELLDDNITKYKPDITICMMGMNNGLISENKKGYLNIINNNKFQNKIKIYKLYLLLKEHIKSLIKTKEILADNINIDCKNNIEPILQQAIKFSSQAEYSKAETLFKIVLKKDPFNQTAYTSLMITYSFLHREDIAYKMALKALNMPFNDKANYYQIIINYNLKHGAIDKANSIINNVINDKNLVITGHLYTAIKNHITLEQKQKILQGILAQKKDTSYGTIAINYMEQKDYTKANEYFNMAEQLRLNFPNEETNKLYRAIIKKLVDNNIKVICMQYPVRSIKPLQNILKDTDYYDKITFISNEKTFKQALKEKTYDVIFIDQFAGDFGHCTEYGNTLIAKNVTKTLIYLTN